MTKDTEFLVRVVKEASLMITEEFEIKSKDDKGDLVTNFDYEIEKYIIGEINKEYPDFDIVSEEFNSDGKLTQNCFTIDPIDGTINFANKCPEWVIQVACVKNGEPCAAVIFAPKTNEMYVADEGDAYLNGIKIHVNNLPVEKCLYEIDGKKRVSAIERMMPYSRHFRNVGCVGIVYAYVAAGRFGGVIFRKDTVWDYLPGMFIVKQAGGCVIDEPNCHVAACTKEFADILRENAKYLPNDK